MAAVDGQLNALLPPARISERARAFYALGKPNLSLLVVVTAVTGFYLASSTLDFGALLNLVCGLFLTSIGACALNMAIEHDIDAKMHRTRTRPIPAGTVSRAEAYVFSAITFGLGFLQLALTLNLLSAMLSLFTIVTYGMLYTPLKAYGSISTWVGAIPGAMPPVIGWTAVRGEIDAPALVLGAILFFWQIPHFLALAWMYREDYARAGYQMLPGRGVDGSVRLAGIQMMACCLGLLLVSLVLWLIDVAGMIYLVGASICGILFLFQAIRVAQNGTKSEARKLFFASIMYFPAIFAVIVFDRWIVAG